MCGINGICHFNNSSAVSEKEVISMRDTLIHRGPDDAGIYVSPDKKVGFGTRRLKIIDLSEAGHMPLGASRSNSKSDIWITYNGEVYNFRELRDELEKKGYRFKSKSDTEVILSAYLEYGVDCVKHLEGMFAFAIWDEGKKTLFAARDRMGIKPFFYYIANGTLLFGSEIKAILAYPNFKKELDHEGVSHYLTFGSAPSPFTLIKGVKKLPAGHYLTIKNEKIEVMEYWNPINAQVPKTEGEYIKEIQSLLKNSIRAQMVSDVPFGCFLSGGVDSSLNAKLMSDALGRPIETFSVGYRDFEEKNEFVNSRVVADTIGIKPHEILLDESHMREFLKSYAYYADDPVSDQVCFPLFCLSKFTKENGVTVVQIGEGADEIFAGYTQYIRAMKFYESLWRPFAHLPSSIKNGASVIAKIMHASSFTKEYANRFSKGQEPFWGLAVAFGDNEKLKLTTSEFRKKTDTSSYKIIERYYKELDAKAHDSDFLKRVAYIEMRHRLPEFLLARADKMTMAHSIEGRVPFLNTRLIELAWNIPTDIKIKGNQTKYILKKAAEGIIPQKIIDRKKQGFSNPIGEWLKRDDGIGKELEDIIFNSKFRECGILNYDYVRKLIDAHRGGSDQNFKLWNLITLSLWYDYWF